MSNNAKNKAVSTRVQTFTFNNGTLSFSLDMERIAREGMKITGDYNVKALDSLVVISLKTLIHRTTKSPQDGKDATQWMLDFLSGDDTGGRFKISAKDKEKALNAFKMHGHAPEQTEADFQAKYGVEMTADLGWLEKFYFDLRVKAAEADKKSGL